MSRKRLHVIQDLEWLPKPNQCTQYISHMLPPEELITSAFAFVFVEGKLLLCKLYRGWDLPGGHIERGESAKVAVKREVREETGVVVDQLQLFGYQELRTVGQMPNDYRYPFPVSYQVFYLAQLKEWGKFHQSNESYARKLFSLQDIKLLPNLQTMLALVQAAFTFVYRNET